MAGYKEKNIQCLRKHNPIINSKREYFDKIFNDSFQEEKVQLIDEIPFFQENGNWYQLRSRFPKEEALYILKNLKINKDNLIILLGMGNIEVLLWLLNNTSNNTRIAVLEPNVFVFLYMIEYYDFEPYISSTKFSFIIGNEEIMKSQAFAYSTLWINLTRNIEIFMQPNYHVYQNVCLQVVQYIKNRIILILNSFGNSLQDKIVGFKNIYQNVDACIYANSYQEYMGKYENFPAIIVASGPSLDKNIQYLKGAQGKALIIACDASYQICIENGVKPDAIASIERGEPTYRLFYKDKEMPKDLVLIAPCLLWPKIYEEFKGKMLLFSKNSVGYEQWLSDFFPSIKFLSSGHSCATLAFGFAKDAGCDPIILVGQDLAYTDDKLHSDTIREKIYQSSNDATKRYKPEAQAIWVESVNGGKVRTNEVFNLFRAYFEDSILIGKQHVIDATEGGALIHGADNRTLKETIEKYCVKEIGFFLGDLLSDRKVEKEEKLEYYQKIQTGAEDLQKIIDKLMEMVVNHENRLKKYQNYDFLKASPKKLQKILKEMQKGNKIITFISKEGEEIHIFYQHIIKSTVIRINQLGNQLTGEALKGNWELQVNLMNMFRITSNAVSKEIDAMKEFLQEKIVKEKEQGV